MDEKEALVPRLRFPGFRDAGVWEAVPLGRLGHFFRGLTYGADDVADGGLLVLRSSNIQGGRLILDSDLVFVAKTCPPELRLKRGDIVICMSNGSKALVGKSGELECDYPSELTVGAFCSIFRPLIPFAKIAFNTPLYMDFVANGIAGGNINNLKNSDLERFCFHVPPSRSEQQKIADCLSSLDALIVAQADKIDALKTHKKGLMQQLFPREGETAPRLRFPEFRDAGEWEWRPLGEIAEIKLGKMLDKKKHRSGHLLPYLNNLAVRWNDFDTSNLPKMYFDTDELEKYDLAKGDVIVCEGGEPGRSAVWDGRLSDMKFQKALHRVRFQIQFVPHLLVHYLETIAGAETFESLFTGGGIKHLTRQTFAILPIPVASPAEQDCIANCLSFLDALISAHKEKLDVLKAHKKGLMQQLFPMKKQPDCSRIIIRANH